MGIWVGTLPTQPIRIWTCTVFKVILEIRLAKGSLVRFAENRKSHFLTMVNVVDNLSALFSHVKRLNIVLMKKIFNYMGKWAVAFAATLTLCLSGNIAVSRLFRVLILLLKFSVNYIYILLWASFISKAYPIYVNVVLHNENMWTSLHH